MVMVASLADVQVVPSVLYSMVSASGLAIVTVVPLSIASSVSGVSTATNEAGSEPLSSCTVQPSGMPSTSFQSPCGPTVQSFMPAALIKVPLSATPVSQPPVQPAAEMSVARHFT